MDSTIVRKKSQVSAGKQNIFDAQLSHPKSLNIMIVVISMHSEIHQHHLTKSLSAPLKHHSATVKSSLTYMYIYFRIDWKI